MIKKIGVRLINTDKREEKKDEKEETEKDLEREEGKRRKQ